MSDALRAKAFQPTRCRTRRSSSSTCSRTRAVRADAVSALLTPLPLWFPAFPPLHAPRRHGCYPQSPAVLAAGSESSAFPRTEQSPGDARDSRAGQRVVARALQSSAYPTSSRFHLGVCLTRRAAVPRGVMVQTRRSGLQSSNQRTCRLGWRERLSPKRQTPGSGAQSAGRLPHVTPSRSDALGGMHSSGQWRRRESSGRCRLLISSRSGDNPRAPQDALQGTANRCQRLLIGAVRRTLPATADVAGRGQSRSRSAFREVALRFQIVCHHVDRTILGIAKPCGYRWQTSGESGAVLAVKDHRRGFPGHDLKISRLKAKP